MREVLVECERDNRLWYRPNDVEAKAQPQAAKSIVLEGFARGVDDARVELRPGVKLQAGSDDLVRICDGLREKFRHP